MRSWNYKLLCGAVCLAQLACLSLPVWAAQNSAAFTRQTTLQQLRDDPAIKSSGYYTYCRELSGLGNEYWKNKTLEQYMRPELVDDSVAAMNLVAENTRNGVQVTWQVYSPEEIAANSSLGCVQLYYCLLYTSRTRLQEAQNLPCTAAMKPMLPFQPGTV